jgi:hypothetical protein
MQSIVILTVVAVAIVVAIALIVRARAKRKSRPRVVELPNSAYTPKLVLDRDAEHRWHAIPLDELHEINRGEVMRLLDRVTAAGVDSLRRNEREFLDNLAERLVHESPTQPPRAKSDFRLPGDAGRDSVPPRPARGELHPPL